jgi:hypothetical protein
MPNSVVVVADGDFRFDPSAVFDVVGAAWPRSTFAGVSGRLSEVSAGQITVREGEELVALVEVDVAGGGARRRLADAGDARAGRLAHHSTSGVRR